MGASQSLGALAGSLPGARVSGDAQTRIEGLSFDSRRVKPGDLFIALTGTMEDGAHYVAHAFRNGAAAAAVERAEALPEGRPGLIVPSSRYALGLLAALWEGYPARRLRLIGVTGTDGKTTTASLIASILRAAGRHLGVVTTVGAEIADEQFDTGFHTTTPDAPDLQRYLRRMIERGATDAVIEVTSHALAHERVAGCDFDLAVITNVTRDHFDLHRTFEAYLATKVRLFESLISAAVKPGIPKGAVYNLDDPSAPLIEALAIPRRLSYALEKRADVRARAVRLTGDSAQFDADTPVGAFPVLVPLPGWYNVANALAAISAGILLEVPATAIQSGLASFRGVSGRMEKIDLGQPFEVYVDFAHTPNSLEQVLSLARERCRRRVSVVFGCAGRRDSEKRPLMGEVAARYADRIYLTAEDPRTESLDTIFDDIALGCRQHNRREGRDYWRIPDRAAAIARAIDDAAEGDLILITGKGHERSMCFGTIEIPWSDQDAVRASLARRLQP